MGIESGSGEKRSRLKKVARAGTAAVAIALAGCGSTADSSSEVDACSIENARALPSAANVAVVEDDRTGDVPACWYMMDMNIPVNTPVELLKSDEETYDSPSFQANGSLGGLAILGTGFIGGGLEAIGETNRIRVTGLSFLGTDGYVQTAVVDSEPVKIKYCEVECDPTVEFVVPDTPLWEKPENDKSSIWYSYRLTDTRGEFMQKVAVVTGDPDVFQHVDGGPQRPGQVIRSLSSEIKLVLPASAKPE